jgi:hypothetical protein
LWDPVSLPPGSANAVALSYRADLVVRDLAAATIARRLAALHSAVKLARTLEVEALEGRIALSGGGKPTIFESPPLVRTFAAGEVCDFAVQFTFAAKFIGRFSTTSSHVTVHGDLTVTNLDTGQTLTFREAGVDKGTGDVFSSSGRRVGFGLFTDDEGNIGGGVFPFIGRVVTDFSTDSPITVTHGPGEQVITLEELCAMLGS